jgi:hypothetical protein
VIRVSRRTWRGLKLEGWQDDKGNTYKTDWGPQGRLIYWSLDNQGRVYTEFDGLRAHIGWVGPEGIVYDRYAVPYWRTGSRGVALSRPTSFLPGMEFRIRSDGAVFGRRLLGTREMGRVEGTSDLRLAGALVLLLLGDYD